MEIKMTNWHNFQTILCMVVLDSNVFSLERQLHHFIFKKRNDKLLNIF